MYVMKSTKLGAISTKPTAEVTSGERGRIISNEGGVIGGISAGEGELQFLSLELFKHFTISFQYCIIYMFQNI